MFVFYHEREARSIQRLLLSHLGVFHSFLPPLSWSLTSKQSQMLNCYISGRLCKLSWEMHGNFGC